MKTHTIKIQLSSAQMVHLIGFIAIAELSPISFIRTIASKLSVSLKDKLNSLETSEVKQACDTAMKQLAHDRIVRGKAQIKSKLGEPLVLLP